MSFSLYPGSPLAGTKQYEEHIDKIIYLKNLRRTTGDVTNYLLTGINKRLDENDEFNHEYNERNIELKRELSLRLNGTFEEGFNQLSENLSEGFSELSGVISDLGSNIESLQDDIRTVGRCLIELNNLLDWKTDRIIECQNKTNEYLKELLIVTNRSDDEKKKIEHINSSGMYLTNAMNEGPDSEYFQIAMDYLQKIDGIDQHDFISHFRKGIIYCQSKASLNIDEAIKCFSNCILYSKAILNSNSNLAKKQTSEEIIQTSYFYLSICEYVNKNFFQALNHAEQAYKLMSTNPAFCLRLAKMLCVNNRAEEAIEYARQAIVLDPNYVNEVINDDDLISKIQIKDFINEKVLPLIVQVEELLDQYRTYCVPETKEEEELSTLISSFNKSYVRTREIVTKLESTNLLKRIDNTNELFFKACSDFQKEKDQLIESVLEKYTKEPWHYENDFKSKIKQLVYFPTSFRFYIEKNVTSGKRKAFHTNDSEKIENAKSIGAVRTTLPFVNKLETFDFRWFEWTYKNEVEKNKLTPISRITKQGDGYLVIKRNLNHYAFYLNDNFGFSVCTITSDGYLVDIGFTYYIRIFNPLALMEKYDFGNYPINLSRMLATLVKEKLGKIPYRDIRYLHELRQDLMNEINNNAAKDGFQIHSLFFHGIGRFTFRNYKLELAK